MSILLTLLFQPGHWAKTGSTIWITFNEATPGTGKLEKANRVARRRCIKNDVIKAGQQEASVNKPVNSSNAAISVVQAPESCSLILLTTSSGRRPLIGSTILERYCWAASCGSISRAESPGTAHRANGVTDSLIEYLTDIGGWIGTDQQNPLTLFSKADSRRAGNRSFSYTSLTGKKQVRRDIL
jgi:hypothetical protein